MARILLTVVFQMMVIALFCQQRKTIDVDSVYISYLQAKLTEYQQKLDTSLNKNLTITITGEEYADFKKFKEAYKNNGEIGFKNEQTTENPNKTIPEVQKEAEQTNVLCKKEEKIVVPPIEEISYADSLGIIQDLINKEKKSIDEIRDKLIPTRIVSFTDHKTYLKRQIVQEQAYLKAMSDFKKNRLPELIKSGNDEFQAKKDAVSQKINALINGDAPQYDGRIVSDLKSQATAYGLDTNNLVAYEEGIKDLNRLAQMIEEPVSQKLIKSFGEYDKSKMNIKSLMGEWNKKLGEVSQYIEFWKILERQMASVIEKEEKRYVVLAFREKLGDTSNSEVQGFLKANHLKSAEEAIKKYKAITEIYKNLKEGDNTNPFLIK